MSSISHHRWIGLDVGGANLKASDGMSSYCEPFALWQNPDQLTERIARLLNRLKPYEAVALTMTGELADCYASKAEGVHHIIKSTRSAAGELPVHVATVDDSWLTLPEAFNEPQRVAAANWRVFARFVAKQFANQLAPALVADAGSTTVDLIPIQSHGVATPSRTDTDRLLAGELLYTGVRRTPVCAIVHTLPYRGRTCPVAAEWFATTADVWLLLGELKDSTDEVTADGRPLDRPSAVTRLGRCLCADENEFNTSDAMVAAETIARAQVEIISRAVQQFTADSPLSLYVSGEGEFLLRRAAQLVSPLPQIISLSKIIGHGASQCGPAHALAMIAADEIDLLRESV